MDQPGVNPEPLTLGIETTSENRSGPHALSNTRCGRRIDKALSGEIHLFQHVPESLPLDKLN